MLPASGSSGTAGAPLGRARRAEADIFVTPVNTSLELASAGAVAGGGFSPWDPEWAGSGGIEGEVVSLGGSAPGAAGWHSLSGAAVPAAARPGSAPEVPRTAKKDAPDGLQQRGRGPARRKARGKGAPPQSAREGVFGTARTGRALGKENRAKRVARPPWNDRLSQAPPDDRRSSIAAGKAGCAMALLCAGGLDAGNASAPAAAQSRFGTRAMVSTPHCTHAPRRTSWRAAACLTGALAGRGWPARRVRGRAARRTQRGVTGVGYSARRERGRRRGLAGQGL